MGRENSKYFLQFYLFYYLLLAVLGLCSCAGFSLVVGSKSCSLAKVLGLLIAVASLIAEHRYNDLNNILKMIDLL